jgi:hypothetical protein
MKKGLLIGGGVVAIGAVAYFLYIKQKKKEEGLVVGSQLVSGTIEAIPQAIPQATATALVNSQIAPIQTGGVVANVTTFVSIEDQKKLDQARDLFEKIKQLIPLEKKRVAEILNFKSDFFRKIPPQNPYTPQLNKYKDDLLNLGYEIKGESNPILVKLNSL